MFQWSIVFLLVAAVAGYLSLPHIIEPAAAAVAKYVFLVSFVLFVIFLVIYLIRGQRSSFPGND